MVVKSTFGERDDVIVFKAKASLTIAEAFADDVTGGIFTPPFRMSSGDYFGFGPTEFFDHGVEEPWSFMVFAVVLMTMW